VDRPQRLVFGTVAEAYDAHRPGYPDELLDDLVAMAGTDARALDAGAGTGKVAAALAARGLIGTALEPDPDMAAVARRNVEASGWEVVLGELETAELAADGYGLFTCAQAWHWIDPERGLAQVRHALRPGGVAAIFWNRPTFDDDALRADLDAVYARLEPELESSLASKASGHKGVPPAVDPAPAGFVDVEARTYGHAIRYTTERWVGYLGTHSNHVMLEPARRRALHDEVARTIDAHGGAFDLTYRCEAWIARRA